MNYFYVQVPSEMGNKPSVSEGEDDEDRPPFVPKSLKPLSSNELTNGGGEDVDDEVELPPPMKPIQEPILVTGPPNVPGVLPIEEDPRKRVSNWENFERTLFSACYVTAFCKHAKDVTQLKKLGFLWAVNFGCFINSLFQVFYYTLSWLMHRIARRKSWRRHYLC